MPVLGYLTPAWVPHLAAAFRQGLAEAGYEEGKNIAIEIRVIGLPTRVNT